MSIAAEGIVFAGDIFFTDLHPYIADGDLAAWQKTLDSIMTLNAEKIIQGHGPLSTNIDLEDMKSYIVVFDKKARELAAISSQCDYIAAELKKYACQNKG